MKKMWKIKVLLIFWEFEGAILVISAPLLPPYFTKGTPEKLLRQSGFLNTTAWVRAEGPCMHEGTYVHSTKRNPWTARATGVPWFPLHWECLAMQNWSPVCAVQDRLQSLPQSSSESEEYEELVYAKILVLRNLPALLGGIWSKKDEFFFTSLL